MLTVWVLALVAAGALVAWVIAPDTWWATVALLSAGGAAYRAVTMSTLAAWWRYAVGIPPAVGVVMLWWADGHLLAVLLWVLAILMLRLAVRGLLTARRSDRM